VERDGLDLQFYTDSINMDRHMNEPRCTGIAEQVFRQIKERFPHFEMKKDDKAPVELNIDIPIQPGLKYSVNLNLQNEDELHFNVEYFWLEWCPCTDPSRVADYIDAVSGFLSGKYRVLEHYRGKRCIKAELQAPEEGGDWKTIGSSVHLGFPWPWRKWHREIINA
jgi:hypothetical protein